MDYYATLTRTTPSTLIRRERMLPRRGQVLVDIGDRVDSVDIIGRCRRPGSLLMLNAGARLNLRGRALTEFLVKRSGDAVQKGETIAAKPRLGKLFPRVLRAPTDGRIVAVGDSQVMLETEVEEIEVRAHISGRIISVMPERGAVVETQGALVQCARGFGAISHGVLRAAVGTPEEVLTEDKVDVSCLGAVVIGGADATEEALVQLGKIQARGLILGGLSSDLIPVAAALPFPVVTTEGIGPHPLNDRAFAVLTEQVGREACADAGDTSRWVPRRPEVIVSLTATGSGAPEAQIGTALRPGQVVRILRGEHAGSTGRLSAFPAHAVHYGAGLGLASAEVQLQSGGQTYVPVNNLEILA